MAITTVDWRPLRLWCNLSHIFAQLRAELAPAIRHNEHSAVSINNFGNYMLVQRVSGDTTCELPKCEPVVVFNKNLENLVENTIWIRHQVYSTSFRKLARKFRRPTYSKCPAARNFRKSIVVAAETVVISGLEC